MENGNGTNRRVLSDGDEYTIRKIIKEEHAEQYKVCGLTFVAKDNYGAAFWVKLTLIIGMCGTALAYFIIDHTEIATTSAIVSKNHIEVLTLINKKVDSDSEGRKEFMQAIDDLKRINGRGKK